MKIGIGVQFIESTPNIHGVKCHIWNRFVISTLLALWLMKHFSKISGISFDTYGKKIQISLIRQKFTPANKVEGKNVGYLLCFSIQSGVVGNNFVASFTPYTSLKTVEALNAHTSILDRHFFSKVGFFVQPFLRTFAYTICLAHFLLLQCCNAQPYKIQSMNIAVSSQ